MNRTHDALSRLLPLILLGLALCPGGCTSAKTSDRSIVYVEAADALALSQGEARLFGLAPATRSVYVDARTETEYREAHLPGAVHLPIEDAREQHRPLREFDVLIVYGNDFNSIRADALSKTLIELGHDVRTLRGGLRAWRDAGNPVE